MDVVKKSQIIEVKKSASSLKVDQIRLVDPTNPQFFNFDNREVIIYIEESIEGITNPQTLRVYPKNKAPDMVRQNYLWSAKKN